MHCVWQFSIATVMSTAALGSLNHYAKASEWGCEVLLCASSFVARCSCLSPTDAQAHLGDERLGFLMAHLPRSRHRKTRL